MAKGVNDQRLNIIHEYRIWQQIKKLPEIFLKNHKQAWKNHMYQSVK